MSYRNIRLFAWPNAGGACRFGERVSGGWRLSAPLDADEVVKALQALATGEPVAFAGEVVVVGVVGGLDIADYAAPLSALLAARQALAPAVGAVNGDVRLLVWGTDDHRLAEARPGGSWRLSARLGDRELGRAMRAIAGGRRPKFASKIIVDGVVGADDITDGAAQAVADKQV